MIRLMFSNKLSNMCTQQQPKQTHVKNVVIHSVLLVVISQRSPLIHTHLAMIRHVRECIT